MEEYTSNYTDFSACDFIFTAFVALETRKKETNDETKTKDEKLKMVPRASKDGPTSECELTLVAVFISFLKTGRM